MEDLHAIKSHVEALAGDVRPSQVDAILSRADDRVLLAAWAATPDTARQSIADYANRLRHINTVVDGSTLGTRGLRPGPHFGTILRCLRSAWLDGEIESSEQEEEMLERLLAELGVGSQG